MHLPTPAGGPVTELPQPDAELKRIEKSKGGGSVAGAASDHRRKDMTGTLDFPSRCRGKSLSGRAILPTVTEIRFRSQLAEKVVNACLGEPRDTYDMAPAAACG